VSDRVAEFLDGLEAGGFWDDDCPVCGCQTPHPDGSCKVCGHNEEE